jgi:hypothetical protein
MNKLCELDEVSDKISEILQGRLKKTANRILGWKKRRANSLASQEKRV